MEEEETKVKVGDLITALDMAFFTLGELSNSTHAERVVDRDELPNGIIVDTCWVNDFTCYETAIFNDDPDEETHVVERYEDKEAAQLGHDAWVARIQDPSLTEITALGPPGMDWMTKKANIAHWKKDNVPF